MNAIASLFATLDAPGGPIVSEVHGAAEVPCSRGSMRTKVQSIRQALRTHGAKQGDRAVLVAPNSIGWVAADLAMLAEGLTVVPMYARQDRAELVEMMHDCEPSVVLVADDALARDIEEHWPEAPLLTLTEASHTPTTETVARHEWQPDEVVTIVYTSGTSGPPKGVMITSANLDYMLPSTASALSKMMNDPAESDRVFHYLPFCFAGSRIVLWTTLVRGTGIKVSTDLDNLLEEIGTAAPHYFLNVPMLLERIKTGVEKNVRTQVALVQFIYDKAIAAHLNRSKGIRRKRDTLVLKAADRILFGKIRAKIGPNLRCLICGSAPLAEATQRWFEMLGIPVYQVYGLTETTAIVTMDQPPEFTPGRVGPALSGLEVKIGEGEELMVRGPNIFAGYWRKPEATAEAIDPEGWFHTGDRADVDDSGNWRIIGRTKNLLVPTSGHNIAPEPIEQEILQIEGVEQAVLFGHARPWVGVLVHGDASDEAIDQGLQRINKELPHYRRVRKYVRIPEPLTIENGLLTANRKLRRTVIEKHFAASIDEAYTT